MTVKVQSEMTMIVQSKQCEAQNGVDEVENMILDRNFQKFTLILDSRKLEQSGEGCVIKRISPPHASSSFTFFDGCNKKIEHNTIDKKQ